MSLADKQAFPIDSADIDWKEFHNQMILGLRLYMFKEDMDTLPEARKRLKKLKFFYLLCKYLVFFGIIYVFWTLLARQSCVKLINFK